MTIPGCRAGRWAAVLVLAILVLTGCDRAGSPEEELRTAADRTLEEDVAFTLATRGDRAAFAGADAGETAAFLATFQLRGVREAAGPYAFAVDIGGTAPLLEVRGGGGQPLLLRTGFGALLGAEGDPEAELGPQLDELGVEGDQRAALVAGFAGDWIALTDAEDVADLAGPALGGDDGAAADDAAAGTERAAADPFDLARLFAALEVGEARDVGDVRRFDVVLDVEAWLGASLGEAVEGGGLEVPSRAPGSVTVRDGRVHEVRLELAGEDEPARLELVVALSEHGAASLPEPAEPVAAVTVAELVELIALLDGSPAER